VVLALGLRFGLSGCVTTGLAVTPPSPWQPVGTRYQGPARSIGFTRRPAWLPGGQNRLILETEDGGALAERSLRPAEATNYRLLSV